MNRRQFSAGLSTLFGASLLPSAAITSPNTAAPVAKAVGSFKSKYNWGAFQARVHGQASPQFFQEQLRMSKAMAHQVHEALVQNKVLGLPDASGMAKALDPLINTPTELAKINANQRAKQALKKAQEKLNETLQDDPDANTSHEDTAEPSNA